MTVFLRMLEDRDKMEGLRIAIDGYRTGKGGDRIFEVRPQELESIPGSPFSYWISENVLNCFEALPDFEGNGRSPRQGLATADDFRFIRVWWECAGTNKEKWKPLAKGGVFSPFYCDVFLNVNWNGSGDELDAFSGSVVRNSDFYFRPGLTWPRRTKSRLSMRVLPSGCIFADKGPAVFDSHDDEEELLAVLSICASDAFYQLVELQLAAADVRAGGAAHSFEVGVIKRCPVPELQTNETARLAGLARNAWSLKRTLDTTFETSHAFSLPAVLRERLGDYDRLRIEAELASIQTEIDAIAFELYGFSAADRVAAQAERGLEIDCAIEDSDIAEEDSDEEDNIAPLDQATGLLSWAVGVAFGRFDWRLATGERSAPPAPKPFDPLPVRSAGMLPLGANPFNEHGGILVDDPSHKHDVAQLVEDVLVRVEASVPFDIRSWLKCDFFPIHLQRYSKSRRRAPIYWPLSTLSGSYTLWLYYPSLTSQTLYSAVNDFIDGPSGKLKQVATELTVLRNKGNARNREDERNFEALQALELELIELRDTLLQIAPTYCPNHDDGIPIIAAPLWQLFRHKPWQKLLKDTWAKLEKGDYDWAHLAMVYWPERVREKCKNDKSLAIAHGLEELYVEPEPKAAKKRRGAK